MAAPDFNPRSSDATFAGILTRLDQQDRQVEERHKENGKVLERILTQTTATNGRVTKLETKMEGRWKYLAGGSAGASATALFLWELFKHFFSKSS